MALEKNFYSEIYENEQKWIELITNGLLPGVYCEYTLKPFYEKKVKSLIEEYSISGNSIIFEYIKAINKIIEQIDINYNNEKSNQIADMTTLLPLFLSSQMRNTTKKEKVENTLDELRIKRAVALAQVNNIKRNTQEEEPDYLYDDFPEEVVTKRH